MTARHTDAAAEQAARWHGYMRQVRQARDLAVARALAHWVIFRDGEYRVATVAEFVAYDLLLYEVTPEGGQ